MGGVFGFMRQPRVEEEGTESSASDVFEEDGLDNASLAELRAIIAREGLAVSGGVGGIAKKVGSGPRGGRTKADIVAEIREARSAKEIGIVVMIFEGRCRRAKMQVKPQHTIADVKDMIRKKERISVDEHCMYGSKQLEEGRTVSDANIQQDAVLMLAHS